MSGKIVSGSAPCDRTAPLGAQSGSYFGASPSTAESLRSQVSSNAMIMSSLELGSQPAREIFKLKPEMERTMDVS